MHIHNHDIIPNAQSQITGEQQYNNSGCASLSNLTIA